MKKRLLVLPLLALALIACDNSGGTETSSSDTPNSSQNNSSETPNTSTSTDGGTTSEAPNTPTGLEAGDYNVVLRDETNNLVWYATGEISDKGALTVDHSNAKVAVLSVSKDNDKYTLKIGENYLEAYLNGTYKNMRLVSSPSTDAIEWKWSEEYNTFSATYEDGTRYLGANYYNGQVDNLYQYGITLSEDKYFTDNPVVIHYEKFTPVPVESISTTTSDPVSVEVGKTIDLSTNIVVSPENATNKEVEFELADSQDEKYVTLTSDGKVTGKEVKEGNITINVKSKADSTKTCTIEVTVSPASGEPDKGSETNPYSVAEAIEIASALGSGETSSETYYVQGYVVSVATSRLTITDNLESGSQILVYKNNEKWEGIHEDDLVKVNGNFQNYNGNTPEVVNPTCQVVEAAKYQITIQPSENGTVTIEGDKQSDFAYDDSVTLKVAPAEGYKLQTLTVGGAEVPVTENTYTFKVTKSVEVTATFVSASESVLSVVYSLDTSVTGKNSSYASNGDVEVNGITWNIEGNNTQKPWRFGGKNLTDQDRSLTSKTPLNYNVAKVEIEFGAATCTVSKVTFSVYKQDPTTVTESNDPIFTKDLNYAANGKDTIVKEDVTDWTGCYYRVTFTVSAGSSNQYATIAKMDFYAYA